MLRPSERPQKDVMDYSLPYSPVLVAKAGRPNPLLFCKTDEKLRLMTDLDVMIPGI